MGNKIGDNINIVSINSLINAIGDENHSRRIRCQLMPYISFINFDAKDILYWIELNQKVSFEVIARFLTCSSEVDVMSFVAVYCSALAQLKDINQDWAKLFALELITNTEKICKRATYYKMTVISALQGEVNTSLPYVKQHAQNYRKIVEYTVAVNNFIRHIFFQDQEICEKLSSISAYIASAPYLLSLFI